MMFLVGKRHFNYPNENQIEHPIMFETIFSEYDENSAINYPMKNASSFNYIARNKSTQMYGSFEE